MRRVFRQRSEAFDLGLVFVTSGGLRQRRSRRVIGDEIKARLRGYFENERLGIFDKGAAHGSRFQPDLENRYCRRIPVAGRPSAQRGAPYKRRKYIRSSG
jgi:hypothetical protein